MTMSSKVKIIANYLPQYHRIPENDKWWGEGFTDWVAVKKSQPFFEGHRQPRIPLNNNYYDLSNPDNIRWQAKIAKEHGIYGFGIYHYWFSSEQQLLQTPSEILLNNKDIDTNFMFIWDNTSWTRTWSKLSLKNDWAPSFEDDKSKTDFSDPEKRGILAELIYGDEKDWAIHFNYLLKFFRDERYIKIDGKPVFTFHQTTNNFETIQKIVKYWDSLAKENGFPGIVCMNRDILNGNKLEKQVKYSPFPMTNHLMILKHKLKSLYCRLCKKQKIWDYDRVWKDILFDAKISAKDCYLCGFVDYDDTPRRGKKGLIIKGGNPQKFEKYMNQLVRISKKQNKEYVFLMAWNEWGEGSYLEPDTEFKFEYLEAIKRITELYQE